MYQRGEIIVLCSLNIFNLGGSFKPVSVLHSLTSRVLWGCGKPSGDDVDKSRGEQYLATPSVSLHIFTLPVGHSKDLFLVRAAFSVPEQYTGLR